MPTQDYAFEEIIDIIRNGIDDIELADELIDRYNEGVPLQLKVVIRAGDYYFDRIWKQQIEAQSDE